MVHEERSAADAIECVGVHEAAATRFWNCEYVGQQGADLVNQSVEQSQVSRALKEAIPPACEVLIYASPRKYLPLRLTSVTTLSYLLDSSGASESFGQSVLSLSMRRD
jgi:hypothetical protein